MNMRLTQDELTMTEALFICIDEDMLTRDTINQLTHKLKETNPYAYIYLEWLCDRWAPLLRSVRGQLPNRYVDIRSPLGDQNQFDIRTPANLISAQQWRI